MEVETPDSSATARTVIFVPYKLRILTADCILFLTRSVLIVLAFFIASFLVATGFYLVVFLVRILYRISVNVLLTFLYQIGVPIQHKNINIITIK